MNQRFSSHVFFGSYSPFSALCSAALIIMASSRFALALICAGALLWVYVATALIFSSARSIMPARGKYLILLFLSSFLCGIFMISMSLLNPLIIMGTGFFLLLIPVCFLGSGFFEASESVATVDVFLRAFFEALVLAGIILAFALVREPLGLGTLSFPGSAQGIVEIFNIREEGNFIPVGILSVSSGGLLLLGYVMALFRYLRDQSGNRPQENGEQA